MLSFQMLNVTKSFTPFFDNKHQKITALKHISYNYRTSAQICLNMMIKNDEQNDWWGIGQGSTMKMGVS